MTTSFHFVAPDPRGAELTGALKLLSGLLGDALMLVREGRTSAADIELAMKLGAGYPAGPLQLLNEAPAAQTRFGELPTHAPLAPANTGHATFPDPIGVVGTGTMGAGIVEALAKAGRPTLVHARSQKSFERMLHGICGRLARAVQKGKLTAAQMDQALALVAPAYMPQGLAKCGLVIEAIEENLESKRRLLATLHETLPSTIPFATNTSSFRVADLAPSALGRPVLAIHFFNPAGTMQLIELVFAQHAEESLKHRARAFSRSIGKVPIECLDHRGFVLNRLLIPFLNDAVHVHAQGVPAQQIDVLMTETLSHPMGPLALIDMIGLDVTVNALDAMAETEDDPRIVPAPLLRDMVREGRLGRKSGQGFYSYAEQPT